jgi:hypothetical protein
LICEDHSFFRVTYDYTTAVCSRCSDKKTTHSPLASHLLPALIFSASSVARGMALVWTLLLLLMRTIRQA